MMRGRRPALIIREGLVGLVGLVGMRLMLVVGGSMMGGLVMGLVGLMRGRLMIRGRVRGVGAGGIGVEAGAVQVVFVAAAGGGGRGGGGAGAAGAGGGLEGLEAFLHALLGWVSGNVAREEDKVTSREVREARREIITFVSTCCHFSPTLSAMIFHIISRLSTYALARSSSLTPSQFSAFLRSISRSWRFRQALGVFLGKWFCAIGAQFMP